MPFKKITDKVNKKITADVVVVGGGPGGSAAAKGCAQRGMRTLLLERHTLPRQKTCSGMIISSMAQAIVARDFGNVEPVLTEPRRLLGYMWHSDSGDESQDLLPPILNVHRSDFDYWLNQKASDAGAEVWEGTLAYDFIQDGDWINLKVKRAGKEQEIRARYLVGADGTASIIRRCLYPELVIHFQGTYRECHAGKLNVNINYHHFFGSSRAKPTVDWFSVTHKKDGFIIQCIGTIRTARELMERAKQTLAGKYGFNPNSKALWSDGTTNRMLRDLAFSGKLIPARGNVLLVGDASGIFTPSERPNAGEGINNGLKMGLLAAGAISKAADKSQQAEPIYLKDLEPLLDVYKQLLAAISSYTINWTLRNKLLDTLV